MMVRWFRHYINAAFIIALAIEGMTIFLWCHITYIELTRSGYFSDMSGAVAFPAFITWLVTLAMVASGVYSRQHFFDISHTIGRFGIIMPITLLLVMLLLLIYHRAMLDDASLQGYYLWGVTSFGLFVPALVVVRRFQLHLLKRFDWLKSRIVLFGGSGRARQLEWLSLERRDRSFVSLGQIDPKSAPDGVLAAAPDLGCDDRQGVGLGTQFSIEPRHLFQFCLKHRINEIVVATKERCGMSVHDLLECKLNGVSVVDFSTFWERESGQIDLDGLSPGWLLFSDGFEMGLARSLIKRLFDLVLATAILIVTTPIAILTIILIKLEDQGPAFYLQKRVGQRGRIFTIIKFRSMRVDAEASGPRWAAENDSRVTRVGAFIRKVRIDEIPQVINVLKGDMSLVGPRPERPVFADRLGEKIPYYNARLAAKPGITGWAQINYPYGASEDDARNKLAYDLYYIKNGSSFLDLIIILQTLKVLLWHDGAR